MSESLSETRVKTYTCGWCHHVGLTKAYDGFLREHVKPGTHSTICRGQETYNMNGRTR